VIVFVVFFPGALEEGVVLCFGVEHETGIVSRALQNEMKASGKYSPSTHNITVSAEYLGQTANDNVRILQNIDIDEVANCLIYYYAEIVLVG
jgi:hypothetical protein